MKNGGDGAVPSVLIYSYTRHRPQESPHSNGMTFLECARRRGRINKQILVVCAGRRGKQGEIGET